MTVPRIALIDRPWRTLDVAKMGDVEDGTAGGLVEGKVGDGGLSAIRVDGDKSRSAGRPSGTGAARRRSKAAPGSDPVAQLDRALAF